MSGLFGSRTIPGNRITDFANQTATVGTPIPFGYGKFVVTQCNIIWIDDVVEHVKKKKQGKGGVKTEEYSYTRSYAIGVCQGPVFGFLIIRRNGKVVYTEDPNAPVEDKDYAAKWKQSAAFYYGTRQQMPDSTIEAKEGAGQVSAFRDLAYIVVENDDVTDGAGAVPAYEVVVVRGAAKSYTTPPYPIITSDGLAAGMEPRDSNEYGAIQDFVGASMAPLDSDLTPTVIYGSYDNYQPEPITASMAPLDSDLPVVAGYLTYSNYVPEPITASMVPLDSDLPVVAGYLTYSNYVPEPITASMVPLNSDLTAV